MHILGFMVLLAAPLSLAYHRYLTLRRNIKLAQDINVRNQSFILTTQEWTNLMIQLPYVILPFHAGGLVWVISYTVVAPLLKAWLPSWLQRDWIE